MPLGIGEEGQGGQASNPTCNPTQFQADNAVNTLQPELVNPAGDDFNPTPSGNVFAATTYTIPDFSGGDRPSPPTEPEGNLANSVTRDFYGNSRAAGSPPGAFIQDSTNTIDPIPTVLANGTAGAVTIASGDTLVITASLNPNERVGANADWWMVILAPSGWYYYDYLTAPGGWQTGFGVTWQGPLFNLSAINVLSIASLSPGAYYVYFGVDTVMDGQVTYDHLYYASVTVSVN